MAVFIRKRGTCLAICLPKAIADSCQLQEGVVVVLQKTAQGLLLRTVHRRKRKLKEMLAKMKGRNPHREIDIGGPVGREIL